MKKRLLALTMALAMTGALAACGGGNNAPAADNKASDAAPVDAGDKEAADADNTATGDTIKIGALAPLTGDASIYGIAASNGSKLYIDQLNANGGINGKQVEYILQDEKGDPIEAVNAYNLLVENNHVSAVLGDVTSTPSIAVAKLAGSAGMPMISPTGTAAEITQQGDSVFRACFLDPFQGKILGDFAAQELKVKTVAVLYDNGNEYSTGLMQAFVESAEANGLQVIATESYATNDIDFRSQLGNIKNTNAEAVFIPDYYNTTVLVASQAREIGLDAPLLGADGWDGVLDVVDQGDVASLNNCFFTNHYSPQDEDPKVQQFLTDYREAYNMEPNSFSALGYDAAMILCAALEQAGPDDAAAIVEAIQATDLSGVTGKISFDENGDPVKNVSIITIENGEYMLYKKM